METYSSDLSQTSDLAAAPAILHPWDVGPAVAVMQELLKAHGYSLQVDGDFGWRTEMVVKQFQRQHHLRIDGVVGVETWSVLLATIEPGKRLLRQGHVGTDVSELQGLLQVNGYVVQRDGKFGAETRSAIISFQRQHHHRDDGIVDAITWSLLRGKRSSSRLANLRNRIKSKK
jgi:peptidoglycan hydrolase-like protein with peptidoglycan-binding domain